MAAVGVFLQSLDWLGFNQGSALFPDPVSTPLLPVTTCLAATAGGIGAVLAYTVDAKPDLDMALNGILAELRRITAGADSAPRAPLQSTTLPGRSSSVR